MHRATFDDFVFSACLRKQYVPTVARWRPCPPPEEGHGRQGGYSDSVTFGLRSAAGLGGDCARDAAAVGGDGECDICANRLRASRPVEDDDVGVGAGFQAGDDRKREIFGSFPMIKGVTV